jgi:hypothetical protein
MKEQTNKIYHVTTRFVLAIRKGVFKEEWDRRQTYDVIVTLSQKLKTTLSFREKMGHSAHQSPTMF